MKHLIFLFSIFIISGNLAHSEESVVDFSGAKAVTFRGGRLCLLYPDDYQCYGNQVNFRSDAIHDTFKDFNEIRLIEKSSIIVCLITETDELYCSLESKNGDVQFKKLPKSEFPNPRDLQFARYSNICMTTDLGYTCIPQSYIKSFDNNEITRWPGIIPNRVSRGCFLYQGKVECKRRMRPEFGQLTGITDVSSSAQNICVIHGQGELFCDYLDVPLDIGEVKRIFLYGNKACVWTVEDKVKCWRELSTKEKEQTGDQTQYLKIRGEDYSVSIKDLINLQATTYVRGSISLCYTDSKLQTKCLLEKRDFRFKNLKPIVGKIEEARSNFSTSCWKTNKSPKWFCNYNHYDGELPNDAAIVHPFGLFAHGWNIEPGMCTIINKTLDCKVMDGGNYSHIQFPHTVENVVDVHVSPSALCWLTTQNDWSCHPGSTQSPYSSEPFYSLEHLENVAFSKMNVCGINLNREIECRGAYLDKTKSFKINEHDHTLPPKGVGARVSKIVTSKDKSCALLDDDSILCWGVLIDKTQKFVGPYKQINSSRSGICALTKPEGKLECITKSSIGGQTQYQFTRYLNHVTFKKLFSNSSYQALCLATNYSFSCHGDSPTTGIENPLREF